MRRLPLLVAAAVLGLDQPRTSAQTSTTAADPRGKVLSRVTWIVGARRITVVQPLATPAAGTPAA